MIRLILLLWMMVVPAWAEGVDIASRIRAPMALGAGLGQGLWALENSGGARLGYVIETGVLAPIAGFSGQPINMLVLLDNDARILEVQLLSQHEPVFVSGLGEAPFRAFLEQYRGRSIHEPLAVGALHGARAGELAGVAKATASVRIAHESIMAASLQVVRARMQGVEARVAPAPDPAVAEALSWPELLEQGLAAHLRVSGAALEQAFAGSKWAGEAAADPYIDLYAIDISVPSAAQAVLAPQSLAELARASARAPQEAYVLLIEAGAHGLVSPEFIRNTTPDLLSATQDDLPLALADADMLLETLPNIPRGTQLVLRLDRRLGFDATRPWQLSALARRAVGMIQPEIGERAFTLQLQSPARFYKAEVQAAPKAAWRQALEARAGQMAGLAVALALLFAALWRQSWLAARPWLRPIWLGFMIGFIGYFGQGQLSIVTVLAALRDPVAALTMLAFDPFSGLLWAAAILGFFLWGRGFFCGWLCPYGALQEFAAALGRRLGLPQRRLPRALQITGPIALAGLVATVFLAPERAESAAEIEPFKTAITMGFARPWPYILWAGGWIALSMVWFKGFCRTLCPLGTVMRLGGLLRLRRNIARRAACGSPCQLCRVRCRYEAISPQGEIKYDQCYQCLDCVTIYDDPRQCVPLILAAKRSQR